MSRLFADWPTIALGWLLVLLITSVVVLLVARQRVRSRHPAPWRDSLCEGATVAGTLPWLVLMLWPRTMPSDFDVLPLRDLTSQLRGDQVSAFLQITANLCVFAVAGFCVPLRWPALRSLRRIALIGFGGSALFEFAQYFLDLGRVASIDDVLCNGGGMVAAAVASRRWWRPELMRDAGR